MDLSRQPPRKPSNLGVGNIANLARMTDKARAYNDETMGEFLYGEDSGLDKLLLDFLDISHDDFADAAGRYDDETLGKWVREVADKTEADFEEFNNHYLTREPDDEIGRQRLVDRIAQFAPGSTDITTHFQSMELDDWGCFRDVDLTAHAPRSPYNRDVAGIYDAARIADKARADKAGKLNDYIYNCPIDQRILGFLGISAETYQEGAYENPNDVEFSDWVFENTNREQWEISQFNAQMASSGPESDEQKEFFSSTLNEIAPERTDITTWFDLLDIDDEVSYNTVDLTRHAPRSPYVNSVGGITGLARMIDKGRASLAGTQGEYWYGEDSGIDRYILNFLGISETEFQSALKEASSDAEVLNWLEKQCKKSENEITEFNSAIAQLAPQDEAKSAWFRGVIQSLDPSRSDVDTYFAMMQLEDQINFARLKAGV